MYQNPLSSSVIHPYLTSVGKTLNVNNIEAKLQKLSTGLSKQDKSDLSYGIKLENHTLVVLTGKAFGEEYIPFFQFPVVFYGSRGEKFIAIDLREYVSNNKLSELRDKNIDDVNLEELFTRYDGVNFLLSCAGIIDKYDSDGFEWLNKDEVIEAYAYLYSFIVRGIITLPFGDNVDVQYLNMLYYFTLLKSSRIEDLSIDKVYAYMNKLTTKFKLTKKDHDILITAFSQSQLNINDDDYCKMKTMLEITSSTLDADKKGLFVPTIFGNNLKTLWMGHGRQSSALMCFECLPVFISMLYSSNKHSTLKDSRLSKIMKDSKIDLKKLNLNLETTFKFLLK